MLQSEMIEVRRILESKRKEGERLDETLKRIIEHARELEQALAWSTTAATP